MQSAVQRSTCARGSSSLCKPFSRSGKVHSVRARSARNESCPSSSASSGDHNSALVKPSCHDPLRRSAILGLAAAMLIPNALPSMADDEYKTFIGYATPPTSYGGYGGNANEPPRYQFEYPAGWKEEQPNKVEKGTQGIDGRVAGPKKSGQKAFVITLGRAGEDNKSFRLGDLESTFAGFAGADYDLLDAVSSASQGVVTTQREVDGTAFYDYDIDSPDFHYLSTITVRSGKVYALFVRSPGGRAFKSNEGQLRHIVSTFKLL